MPKNKPSINIKDFNVLYDNCLVRAIEVVENDGILKPMQYEDKPELGEVLSVGTGRIFDDGTKLPLSVKPGDLVYFNKYSTTKFRIEGEDWYVVREEDIVAYQRK